MGRQAIVKRRVVLFEFRGIRLERDVYLAFVTSVLAHDTGSRL